MWFFKGVSCPFFFFPLLPSGSAYREGVVQIRLHPPLRKEDDRLLTGNKRLEFGGKQVYLDPDLHRDGRGEKGETLIPQAGVRSERGCSPSHFLSPFPLGRGIKGDGEKRSGFQPALE